MSRIKLLYALVEDLVTVAGDISAIADALAENESAPESPAAPQFTADDVRNALGAKSKAGFKDEVRALIAKYGAAKVSDLKPETFAAIIADAEALI
jgi:hypothetical protein